MSNFSYDDFRHYSCEYPLKVRVDIDNGKSITLSKNDVTYECILSVTENFDKCIKLGTIPIEYQDKIFRIEKIINGVPDNIQAQRTNNTKDFKDNFFKEGQFVRWTHIVKTPYSHATTRNSGGRAFINEAEKEAVHWLNVGEVGINPEYITDHIMWSSWRNTFTQLVKFAKNELKGSYPAQYESVHDSTGNHPIPTAIRKVQKFYGFSTKDSYNPSDLYIVKKGIGSTVLKNVENVIARKGAEFEKEAILTELNELFYNEYVKGNIYPISLKKIEGEYHSEKTNIPKEDNRRLLNVMEWSCQCNITPKTQEFGSIKFVTDTDIKGHTLSPTIQFKGYPPTKWSNPQCEFTTTGVPTGGRVGKVPATILRYVFRKYGIEMSYKDIGNNKKGEYMKNLLTPNKDRLSPFGQKMFRMYQIVTLYCDHNPLTENEFFKIIHMVNEGLDERGNPSKDYEQRAFNELYTLLGVNFLYTLLFPKVGTTNNVLTELYYGAKKQSPINGFFIKVY